MRNRRRLELQQRGKLLYALRFLSQQADDFETVRICQRLEEDEQLLTHAASLLMRQYFEPSPSRAMKPISTR